MRGGRRGCCGGSRREHRRGSGRGRDRPPCVLRGRCLESRELHGLPGDGQLGDGTWGPRAARVALAFATAGAFCSGVRVVTLRGAKPKSATNGLVVPNAFSAYCFEQHFPSATAVNCVPWEKSVACSTATALLWDAAFQKMADPSGRAVMDVHEVGYKPA